MKCKFRYQNRFKNVYVQNQKYEEIERDSRKLSPKFYKEERERAERERSCEM
jgi:deoxyhypusine synthase